MALEAFIKCILLFIFLPIILYYIYDRIDLFLYRKKIKRLLSNSPDCPYCGSRPRIYSEYCGRLFFNWAVGCPNCYPLVHGYDPKGDEDLEHTILNWNEAVESKSSIIYKEHLKRSKPLEGGHTEK